MATSLCINNVPEKKPCPYMEKCYRRNPIHFNEMSHPHLETIVIKQLEGEIRVPEKLDFECSDRSLLLDQLKILQIILRREKARNGSSIKELNSKVSNISIKMKNENSTKDSQDLKDKVEKHKQMMLQRRENKLKDMDEVAEALFKASNETKNKDQYKVSKMKEDLDSLKIMEESIEKNCSQEKKRDNSDFQDNERHNKKSKSSHSKYAETDEKYDSKNSQEQSRDSSLVKTFQSCKRTREKAIKLMKKHGYETCLSSLVEPGNFAMKYACSAPYHIFFSTVNRSKETYDQPFSITLPEILDISLGEIVNSLHINFMVDIGWLHVQYMLAEQNTNMSILLGERVDTGPVGSNVTMFYVDMPTKFGCHHTKIMILKYKNDGIRVVVSTANLYMDDWENRTQGVWISPHLPPLSESANSSEGESPTGFKKDLERYLNRYRQPGITEWTCAVRRADFSSVNVFFLASVPGRHTDMEYDSWGHRKLGSILSKHAKLPPDAPQWTLVAQSSSIGSLGPNYESWLQKEITSSMSKENPVGLKSHPNFHFIYPSLNNYKQSFDCRAGSCCLPYSLQTHSKQKWIESYMYQWKAKQTGRDKAMPHIKTYTRISPDLKRIPWFVLTSANLSKAAWGTVGKNSHYIMNYEGGVVFIPSFITGSSTFPIKEEEPGVPVFPIPYDLPLTRYERNDSPFVMEFFSTE